MRFIRAFHEESKIRQLSFELVEPAISVSRFVGIGCDFIGFGDRDATNETGNEYGEMDC